MKPTHFPHVEAFENAVPEKNQFHCVSLVEERQQLISHPINNTTGEKESQISSEESKKIYQSQKSENIEINPYLNSL